MIPRSLKTFYIILCLVLTNHHMMCILGYSRKIEIPEKTSFCPWKLCKIVDTLFQGQKPRTMEIPHELFLNTLRNAFFF